MICISFFIYNKKTNILLLYLELNNLLIPKKKSNEIVN